MNYKYKNYSENCKKFFTQEEIDKMSYNEKFFPTCKCGKKREFRWLKCSDGDSKAGMFYAIAPFKGKNGEEVCHKCAPCVKCGKENFGNYYNAPCVKTSDNPSGEWALAYCSLECFNGRKPKKEPEKFLLNANCDYCRRWSEIKVGSSYWRKSFCSTHCYELAFARAGSIEKRDEIRARCCACGFRIFGQDGNFAENFKNRKGKVFFSDKSINAFYCSEECFEKRGDKSGMSGSAFHDLNPTKSDNFPKPMNPEKDSLSEEKKSTGLPEKSPSEREVQTLIIKWRSIKRITLTAGEDLIIELNEAETNSDSQGIQVINSSQVSSSQEFQKVKNYLKESGEESVDQQKLNSILNSSNTNEPTGNSDNNYFLTTGLSIIAALTIGLAIRLLIKRKFK